MLTMGVPSFAVLALLQFPAVAPAAPASSAPLPLIVERVEFTAANRVTGRPAGIEFTIYNPGPKAILAWGVRVVVTLQDGHVSRGGLSTDQYDSPENPDRGWGPLAAGSRRTEHTGYSKPAGQDPKVVSAHVEPSFVIFGDDTAAGDESEIESCFRQRALNHRAWPVIETVVTDAAAAGGDPAVVLLNIREALARITHKEVRASRAYQQLDQILALNLKLSKLDHSAYLQRMLRDVRMKRAMAQAHYQRSR